MELLSRFNWVDVIVIIIMLRVTYVAFEDGLSHEIFPLVGIVGTLIVCLRYYNPFGVFISRNIPGMPKDASLAASFILLVVVVGFAIKLIRRLVDAVIKVTWHPFIEKFGGAIVGFLRAACIASTILIVIALLPFSYLQRSIKERSVTGAYFLSIGPAIYGFVEGYLPHADQGNTGVIKSGPAKK